MAIQLQKAKKIQAKLKIAISGASGSGKTLSALLLAYGLIHAEHPEWSDADVWDHIALLDTENKSASLYVGKQVGGTVIGSFNVINMEPPYEEQNLIDALGVCKNAQMECAIIDSTSAFWIDALETQGKIAERTKSNFSSWKPVKADQNKMMQSILQADMHVIANYRAKMEYTQDVNDAGKKVVRQLGMGLIAEGTNIYEYTLALMLDADHVANATKDRTGIFDGQYFVITPDTGRKLYQWMAEGEVVSPPPELQKAQNPPTQKANHPLPPKEPAAPTPPDPERIAKAIAAVDPLITAAAKEDKEGTKAKVVEIAGTANYKKLQDLDTLTALYKAFKN